VSRLPSAVVTSTAFVVLAVLVAAHWTPLVRFDTAFSERARTFGLAHPAWVGTLRVVTEAGGTVPFLAAGLALAAVLLWLRRYADSLAVALTAVAVPLVWLPLHVWLPRPRPVGGFVTVYSYGFPSGHSAHVAAAGLIGVLLLRSARRSVRVVTVVAAVVAGAVIGTSRVALLAHWPSDVVGGWLLGVTLAALCVSMVQSCARWRSSGTAGPRLSRRWSYRDPRSVRTRCSSGPGRPG
jgi:undecaprenyl-diphosphatase